MDTRRVLPQGTAGSNAPPVLTSNIERGNPPEGEGFVHGVGEVEVPGEEIGIPAGEDDAYTGCAQRFAGGFNQMGDRAECAAVATVSNGVLRGGGGHGRQLRVHFEFRELPGEIMQRSSRQATPGQDGEAQELAVGVHALECDSGAAVHDNDRSAVEGGGHGICDAVRTNRLRINPVEFQILSCCFVGDETAAIGRETFEKRALNFGFDTGDDQLVGVGGREFSGGFHGMSQVESRAGFHFAKTAFGQEDRPLAAGVADVEYDGAGFHLDLQRWHG